MMVRGAEPADIKRLRIVRMMRVNPSRRSADFARTFGQSSVAESIVHGGARDGSFWICDTICHYDLCSMLPPCGIRLESFAVIGSIVFQPSLPRCASIFFRALLALSQMSIRHLRVPVEVTRGLPATTFETALHGSPTKHSDPPGRATAALSRLRRDCGARTGFLPRRPTLPHCRHRSSHRPVARRA